MVYAPRPKKPMWPTDSRPVKPTTRFRLTARIAQMAKDRKHDYSEPGALPQHERPPPTR